MLNQRQQQKRVPRLLIFLSTVLVVIFLTSFIKHRGKMKDNKPLEPVSFSGYIPLFKMDPKTVNDIISGIPLDKRLIFQFVIDGSTTSAVKVIWYEASGMDSHGQDKPQKNLEAIPNTYPIILGETTPFIPGNNYLHVKTLKLFIRSLPSSDFEYLQFTPQFWRDPEEQTATSHIHFRIRAVYTAKKLRDAGVQVDALLKDADNVIYEEALDSNPSPPFKPGN